MVGEPGTDPGTGPPETPSELQVHSDARRGKETQAGETGRSAESSSDLEMPRGEKAGRRLPSLFRRRAGIPGQRRLWASFP